MNTLPGLRALSSMFPGRHSIVWRLVLALSLAFLLVPSSGHAVDPPPDGRHFDTLTVRGVKHTKVTVIDVAARHVSFRSAQGFSTVLLADLEPEVRAKLGRGELDLSDAWKEKEGTQARDRDGLVVKAREPGDRNEDNTEDEAAAQSVAGFLDQPVHWTFKHIAAAAAIGLGLLVVAVAYCWLIGVAFRTSVGWGIAVLIGTFFAGILNLVFCCSHWKAAKRPVYLKLAGAALIALGIFSFGHSLRMAPEAVAARAAEAQGTLNPISKARQTIPDRSADLSAPDDTTPRD